MALTSAFQYVKKIKSLNVPLTSIGAASRGNIVDWAGNLLAAGMKNLLSGDRQLALARIVEALMEERPNPEVDNYVLFDPRAPKSSSGSVVRGPFKEAIVFMIGGGNYVEHASLQELVSRQQPARHIIYGTTEILTGQSLLSSFPYWERRWDWVLPLLLQPTDKCEEFIFFAKNWWT